MSSPRLHRLLRLILLLQSGRAHTIEAMAAEVGVSRRTLFRDLQMLQGAGLAYEFAPGRGYRLAQGSLMPPINLSVPETIGLLMLGKYAAAQRGAPMSGLALSAIAKLVTTVPEPVRTVCSQMLARVTLDLGPAGDGPADDRHFLTLQRCIDEKRCCQIDYQSPTPEHSGRFVVDPYALHFATRAWYLLARSHGHAEVRTFKLARILQLKLTGERFAPPKRFTAASKIGSAWQLIPEGQVHEVVLEFSPKVASNVAEVRWHASQTQEMLPDGRCRMSFSVDGLGEIAWWLCGYADQVRIVRPAALRQRVHAMLAAAAKNHAG